MKALKVLFTKPSGRIPGTRVALLLIVLAVLMIPPMLLTGCNVTGGVKDAAQILADDVIPRMTGEFEQWRTVWEETRDKLPADVRHQGDLAVERAVQAAGAEFRCEVDFI